VPNPLVDQTTQDLKQPGDALDLVDDREATAPRLEVTARIRQPA
jgi:hypothetical protein